MKVSVVMPVYNEAATIDEVVARVQAVPIEKEIIMIDDGSNDGTRHRLTEIEKQYENVRVILHPHNRGKGAALRTGFDHVTGDIVIIQDADLEYDPQDYLELVKPIIEGKADVVYGSRFRGKPENMSLSHYLGNRFLTFVSNLVNGLKLSDMETCYKVFKPEILEGMTLKSDRFDFEPEFTAKIARKRLRVCEVPIRYYGRTHAEGKKISWRDGIAALFTIIRFRFFDR